MHLVSWQMAKNIRGKIADITQEMGKKLASDVRAVKYVECSALTQKGVKNVFDEATLAALEPPRRNKCVIL